MKRLFIARKPLWRKESGLSYILGQTTQTVDEKGCRIDETPAFMV